MGAISELETNQRRGRRCRSLEPARGISCSPSLRGQGWPAGVFPRCALPAMSLAHVGAEPFGEGHFRLDCVFVLNGCSRTHKERKKESKCLGRVRGGASPTPPKIEKGGIHGSQIKFVQVQSGWRTGTGWLRVDSVVFNA